MRAATPNSMTKTRIICLAGATGTGKTEAALHLADRLKGAVVNFDSRQVYRGLAVVTAEPTAREQSRCPHYLYGFLAPDRELGAGIFVKKAGAAIRHIVRQGLVPILVGGTGLYLRALLGGLDPMPPVPAAVRDAAQKRWEETGPQAMHAGLSECDPVYAAKIHPHDKQRVVRALEVFWASGRPFSSFHGAGRGESLYAPLKLGLRLDLAALTERLDRRIEAMLDAGALEEVRAVMRAYPQGARALTGIGCAELAAHLRGELDMEAARELWLKNTRAYAKRQVTWFKREADMRWFSPGEHEAMADEAADFLAGEADDA
jgi:tRNA dimethylallyltransferase